VIWIIDASVALRWFIKEEAHPQADQVLKELIGRPESFAVPELFAFEVYAVLLRLHPSGIEAYRQGLVPILNGGILRQPMTEKLAVTALQYVRLGLTGYDACYAALARDLKGTWLTFDQKAHRAIKQENVSLCLGKGLPPHWAEKGKWPHS
jgi:predicted nucleic acid-binding protein